MIKDLAKFMAGGSAGSLLTAYLFQKKHEREKSANDRNKLYLDLVSFWLSNKNAGKSMSNYLLENDIRNIAIYGMGTMGELFYEEIENTDIAVEYFIDKSAGPSSVGANNIPVIKLNELKNHAGLDAVIVTPVCYFDSIAADIEELDSDIKIISLEELIYNMQ